MPRSYYSGAQDRPFCKSLPSRHLFTIFTFNWLCRIAIFSWVAHISTIQNSLFTIFTISFFLITVEKYQKILFVSEICPFKFRQFFRQSPDVVGRVLRPCHHDCLSRLPECTCQNPETGRPVHRIRLSWEAKQTGDHVVGPAGHVTNHVTWPVTQTRYWLSTCYVIRPIYDTVAAVMELWA